MSSVAGIDSWSPCWYLEPESPAAARMEQLASVSAARGSLMPASVAGHRVGWHRSSAMLYAEGHPCGAMPGEWTSERLAAVSERDPWLVSPDQLPVAYEGLVEALRCADVPVPDYGLATRHEPEDWLLPGVEGGPGFGGLRRFDSTVDLRRPRAEGLALLAGVAAVATSIPRSQAEVRFAKDGSAAVETVYVRGYSGVKILGRWYDKGLESGWAPRGELVRAEDQRRFPRGHRRMVEELTSDYVRGKFQDRFLPLWQATKGVTVGGVVVLHDRLAELVESDDLTARQATQLAGYVALQRRGVRQGRSTTYKVRKQLRELGLVLADGCLEEVEVDLHQVLDEALESPSWGAQG